MLQQEATPAQIGAFLIAHRIRRPEPQELTGMLDTYRHLGPKLQSKAGQTPPVCFCMPFDGRTRPAPIYPLTTLVLLALGQPVVLQGGESHANQIWRDRHRSVSRIRRGAERTPR
jgi:anthranilate phosphoribosyltransferase